MLIVLIYNESLYSSGGHWDFPVLWCFSCGISVILLLRHGILFYPFKQFQYSVNCRRGTAVFHDFFPSIAVQSIPQCPLFIPIVNGVFAGPGKDSGCTI